MDTYNVMRKSSSKVGGAMNVYQKSLQILTGGFGVAIENLPPVGSVLSAGTPIFCNEGDDSRMATVHYAFKVMNVADAVIQVEKGGEGTRVKAGMFLMEAPATYTDTGVSKTVLSVDTSNETYDEITLDAAITGLAMGDIAVEADAASDTASVKVIPNALSVGDVYVDPKGYDFSIGGAYLGTGVVYQRRIAPLADSIKMALKDNECYFRFSQSK